MAEPYRHTPTQPLLKGGVGSALLQHHLRGCNTPSPGACPSQVPHQGKRTLPHVTRAVATCCEHQRRQCRAGSSNQRLNRGPQASCNACKQVQGRHVQVHVVRAATACELRSRYEAAQEQEAVLELAALSAKKRMLQHNSKFQGDTNCICRRKGC
eukprot:GHRQ01030200.1.p2 GENE.GHRQ01030200.1~~GHRQ01030200.1.p2  ORF type:complete len:155 (-),score=19.70 GHRQ01030200.1:605-1069(-)